MSEKELLSLGKWAEKLELKANDLKKQVKELEIEPSKMKGKCAYYSEEDLKPALEKLK